MFFSSHSRYSPRPYICHQAWFLWFPFFISRIKKKFDKQSAKFTSCYSGGCQHPSAIVTLSWYWKLAITFWNKLQAYGIFTRSFMTFYFSFSKSSVNFVAPLSLSFQKPPVWTWQLLFLSSTSIPVRNHCFIHWCLCSWLSFSFNLKRNFYHFKINLDTVLQTFKDDLPKSNFLWIWHFLWIQMKNTLCEV